MKNRENTRIRLLLKRNPEEGDSLIRKIFPNRFFETDVVSCAGELEQVLDGASPDVVLLDLSNPTLDNRKSFDIARGRHLPPPVIVFGPRKNLSLLTNFLKHGASGMFFIEDDPDVIMHSVRQAAQTHRIRKENDHLKQALEHRDKTVASLEHVGEAMSTVFDVRRILNLTLKVVRRALDCELCSLFLTDHQSGDLMDSRELGFKAGSPQMSLWKDGGKGRDEMLRSAAALCLERGAMVRISGPEERAALLPSASEVPDGGGIQSLLSVPLKTDGGNIGAIVAANRLDGQMFGDRDIDILVSMGRQTALALAGMKRPREEKSFREGLYAQLQVATGKLKERNIELSRRLKEKEEANRKIKDLAREIAVKNQTLEDMVKRFSVIHEIGQVIGSELEDEKLIRKIIMETAGLLHAETVSVMLLESDGLLRIKHAEGLSPDVIKFTRVAPGDGISGWVAREGKPILIRDVASMKKENTHGTLYRSNSLLCVPLKIKGEVIGVLNVTNRKGGGSFNERDLYLLAILGSHAAVAIENARLYSAIRESYFKTIKALVNAVEAKDTWTKDHSENVTNYSLKIADYLGLSESQKEIIRYAGVLHDIGKIVISSTITDKPSPLTEPEWEKIKEHPLIGQRILDPIDFLEPVKVCIQTHHERCDGSGYPFGLKAHEIPLETRILSVADAFDAMIHSRPYRAALSVNDAIDELERFSGTQFDPAVVKGLVRIVEAEEKELSPGH
ncbi:MAG: GAF domain-containing protein [Proteobacteria bacterium]|nr:GAF domain-containing protein [Pseudomonadota bacterium]